MKNYFIKNKFKGWYRDDFSGYTEHVFFAGLYTENEAKRVEKDSGGACVAYLAENLADNYAGMSKIIDRNMKAILTHNTKLFGLREETMKKIECEGVGDNDGFFELEVEIKSGQERLVMWEFELKNKRDLCVKLKMQK